LGQADEVKSSKTKPSFFVNFYSTINLLEYSHHIDGRLVDVKAYYSPTNNSPMDRRAMK